jgi:alkaline phosphatase/alkaline phosphatase D
MKHNRFFLPLISILISSCTPEPLTTIDYQPLLVGEVTSNSAILQTRLVADADSFNYRLMPGVKGLVQFEYATDASMKNSTITEWFRAKPENDYICKTQINQLPANTTIYYRIRYGTSNSISKTSDIQSFQTLAGKNTQTDASFVMVTGMHYKKHISGGQGGSLKDEFPPCSSIDSIKGFPGLESIAALHPDFFIGNGDNVYYDHGFEKAAKTLSDMREHWQRLFSMPRMNNLLKKTATYWLKDDHDFRYDDADTTDYNKKGKHIPLPTVEDGIRIFNEQTPVISAVDSNALPYRTFRINKDLQIWLLEGRDFRSDNKLEDSPKKTIWGKQQKEWLKKTLLESDACYKLLVSPTPMIGPDGTNKIDNHTNIGGYQHERDSFFTWIRKNNLHENGFYILCGDRHWQYHSILDSIEEFSCGALVEQNSRYGVDPGPGSSDPKRRIKQPFTSPEPSGGFLVVRLNYNKTIPVLYFRFYDENGKLLYEVKK